MKSHFSSGFFAGNRRKLRELFTGTAPMVVTANGLLQRGADSTFAFAQDANFWYLTGIEEPDIVLVMDRDGEYLIMPARSAYQKAFDGSVIAGVLAKRSGVKTVYEAEEGWELLADRLKKVKHVATVTAPPDYIEQYGMYTNPARAALAERLKNLRPGLELVELNKHLISLRMIKQPEEQAAIQAAIDITVAGLKETLQTAKLHKYAHEYEVEAELSRNFRRRGAKGHAFEPIVASGERACVLHNVSNNGALSAKELLLVDTGAELEHYAADITRTVGVGSPSPRQQAVHAAVLDVQRYAFSLLKPGVVLREYEHQVERYMGEKLRELGLLRTMSHKNVRRFYPHGTSHFLGLNVHDAGDYERPLEPGMVLTVEPGIYIPKEAIGVRVEDDVLVTKSGIKILTDKLSRELR
jgi:Xaa-Pro aminopeptidase